MFIGWKINGGLDLLERELPTNELLVGRMMEGTGSDMEAVQGPLESEVEVFEAISEITLCFLVFVLHCQVSSPCY